MANETEKTILPYLNVLEVETIDKSNVTKVIVIDKDDEVKVMDGSQLATNSYFDLQDKPEINGVELNGNIPSKELGIPSIEDVDNQITEKLADYPTKEEVTTEITEATAGKQNTLVQGDGIVIEENTISADYNTIRNKPSLNGTELSGAASIVPAINIQSVPSKVTLAPVFGNQTGEAVELPIYNTETNQAGIVNGPLYAQLADKYTKAEIDALNTAINKEIASKQGTLTAGKNISIIDNVISAFENHFLLNLDENDPVRQKHIYDFIRTNLDFYLFCQITYKGDIIVIPVATIEHPETIDLYGYYFQDNGVLVVINAILVNNGNMTVKVTEVDLTNKGYTKEEVDAKLEEKQGVFTPQAPLAFNEDKSQLSVDLSGYQPVGDYALKSDIPTKISELTNDSNFVTEAEVSGDLAGKADKTYVDEQLATKQPVGDYATKTELAGKADSSVVESLSTQVATNTSDISIIKTKQEEDGDKIDSLDKEMATKQDLLVSGTNIKTINSQSLLGEGNINVGDVPSITVEYEQIPNKTDFNRVAEAAANNRAVLIRIKTTEMTLTSNYWQYASSESQRGFVAYATYLSETNNITLKAHIIENQPVMVETYVKELQEELVSGTNIKTINGQDILGSGNLDISGGGGTTDYNQLTNKPQINSVELSGNKSLEDLGIPTKTSELTNDSGFLTSIPDEYVTETELNAGLGNKQDTLVSGTNIKTVNGESLLGSGNIDIESGSNIPFLFINSTTHLSGDFAAVKNAIANKTPFELYYVSILGYGDVAAPEVCFASGENIQATFHFESTTANHTVVQTTITPTGVSTYTSYHSYQEQLVSGTNIKTINGESILGEGNLEISGGGGTTDYTQLTNKPQINSVELSGNKSLSDLGIQPAGNYIEAGTGTQPQVHTVLVVTQSEYDAISSKDPNTQYLIVE